MKINFKVYNYPEEESTSKNVHVSVGTITTHKEIESDVYLNGDDYETNYLTGEMDMQHGAAVLHGVINWAIKNESDERHVYIFDVKGYKGDVEYVGNEPYVGNTMPLTKSSLSELITAYVWDQDLDTLKTMFKSMRIKGRNHPDMDAKIEGSNIVLSKEHMDEFTDEFEMRKMCR